MLTTKNCSSGDGLGGILRSTHVGSRGVMSHQASTSAPEKPRSRLSLNKKTLFQQKLFTATVKHEGESVKPVDTRFSVPFCGLVNLGNTCYINSILQVLRFCPGFTKSVQNLTQPEPPRGINMSCFTSSR